MIYRALLDNRLISRTSASESSVCRFVNQLMTENRMTNNKDMRRYEHPHINEVWCGDSSVGPRMISESGKKKVYIIALFDDASRFITGIDIFFQNNFVNLISVMCSAVSKYGRPKTFNFDNGSSYKNRQMELLCARSGSTLNYCQPYTPTAKAKIERWFHTMKDQWMASLDMRAFHSLDELRSSLYAFVNSYNQAPHSSLGGKSPVDRFFSEPEHIRRLDDAQSERAFLLEIERTISSSLRFVLLCCLFCCRLSF
uniref:DDE-type integrase/transposase/recombinase n=1 Tax=Parablautia muri TaxID=2320879 RepID=UPI0024129FFA|nr:DDE-type integrase/transposase/recombinase [Parablautia muri]